MTRLSALDWEIIEEAVGYYALANSVDELLDENFHSGRIYETADKIEERRQLLEKKAAAKKKAEATA